MTRPIILLPALLFLSCMLASCGETRTARCAQGVLPVGFVGFSAAELDSVYVLQYGAGNNFSSVADSFLHISNPGDFVSSGDTLHPRPDSGFPVMSAGFDYEIRIPATGKAARISGIALEGQEFMTYRVPAFSKVDMDPCLNAVISYNEDGRQTDRTELEYAPFHATILR